MKKWPHLHHKMSLQLQDSVKTFKNSGVLLVAVLKAFPKHQAADDVGHGVMNQCLGIERPPYRREGEDKSFNKCLYHRITCLLCSCRYPVQFKFVFQRCLQSKLSLSAVQKPRA